MAAVWGQYSYSVCCVAAAAVYGMWWGLEEGGGDVCQQNQKQERLIWPDNVDSVTNHSGL